MDELKAKYLRVAKLVLAKKKSYKKLKAQLDANVSAMVLAEGKLETTKKKILEEGGALPKVPEETPPASGDSENTEETPSCFWG